MNKAELIAEVAAKTGKSPYMAKKALNTVLEGIAHGLKHGRDVDLGPKLGRLRVINRKRKRVIKKNLVGKYKDSVVELHRRHPKSVRLLGRNRDLSEDPQPTIVHKKPEPKRVSAIRFQIARPSFRGRPNIPIKRT